MTVINIMVQKIRIIHSYNKQHGEQITLPTAHSPLNDARVYPTNLFPHPLPFQKRKNY
uniref:Uncharacterized protein n=1 Tax=Ascaris lumbricoides TaxID=6252 RepID=A0A0M3I6K7_ASCLU